MKYASILLAVLATVIAALYLAFGGTVLAIALGTIALTGFILGIFFVGFYARHKMGQSILADFLEVQKVNDNYDMAKMQSLSKFGSEIFRLARTQGGNADAGFAPLLGMGDSDTVDANFTIQGLDIDEELEQ